MTAAPGREGSPAGPTTGPDADFAAHRPLLTGLAYRMLGSMWDAEDVVQETYLRWTRADRDTVREPRAFLVTITTRLALDQLRSARTTRESYVGPWLPEPVDTAAAGPLDTAELRDSLSYATLHLMERLTPPERAVFVLRDAFELPYEAVADIVGTPVATCRQHHRRAVQRLADGGGRPRRFRPSSDEHTALLTRFLDAARGGDLAALTDLLADDVVAWNDGGGRTRAALRPIAGREKVAAFVLGLTGRYALGDVRLTAANGQPALRCTVDGVDQVTLLDIRDGRVHTVYAVLNPDKLTRVGPGTAVI
ncbi:RNA polymerase sigma-70 factor, ECF subfamily [Actinacidiphila yanglinensis]|uniref:RNA polymerase sigma-70 factor, ECF subfamily n=1 Tax=Actinacidiphila yanglinensis TaxID=310779 RepID=A0A1H6CW13_9ACTN|nr:RNA polymerase sigma-70 factor [Actinacidiphila yanglinensis]SEG77230.1 RNA polymerase sigma-70 factor, ECF subfamily [Actinacidiphila yanglinensis]